MLNNFHITLVEALDSRNAENQKGTDVLLLYAEPFNPPTPPWHDI